MGKRGRLGRQSDEGIPVQNKFAKLGHIGDEVITTSKVVYKPPPITVPNVANSTIRAHLYAAGVKDYTLRNKTIGVAIYVSCKEDFDLVKKSLNSSQTGFYSHPGKEDRMTKFLLKGLVCTDSNELRGELSHVGIRPAEILEITPKRSRYHDDKLYLLSFKIGEMKLQDLQKIRVVCQQIVTWDKYTPRRKGPTQCRKCQMFGHGTTYCHLPDKCGKCAGNHTTMECSATPEAIKRCANCGKNHEANSLECETRAEYIAIKNRANHQSIKKHAPIQQTPRFVPAPVLPPIMSGWNQVVKGPVAAVTEPLHKANAPGADLFSADECFNIFVEMMSSLRGCTSKAEQLKAITKMAVKYGCP